MLNMNSAYLHSSVKTTSLVSKGQKLAQTGGAKLLACLFVSTRYGSTPSGVVLNRLNSWAHKVHVKSTDAGQIRVRHGKPIVPRNQALPSVGVISSEKDLDKALQERPDEMMAMPRDRENIIKITKKLPKQMLLRDGECGAMMDSSAGFPGVNAKEHCRTCCMPSMGTPLEKDA